MEKLTQKQVVDIITVLKNSKEWANVIKDLELIKSNHEEEILKSMCLVKDNEVIYTMLGLAIRDIELCTNYLKTLKNKLKEFKGFEYISFMLEERLNGIKESIFSARGAKTQEDKKYCELDVKCIERDIINKILEVPQTILDNFEGTVEEKE